MTIKTRIDPITVEIIRNGLNAAADEMGVNLARSAYTPIIYEIKDYSVALFDADPAKIGQRIDGLEIHATAAIPAVIAATRAELGVLTVPAESCQSVAEAMVAAGVRGILNFAPAVLRLPPTVQVVSVDLTVQLEQLAFLVQWNGGEG